VPPVVLWFIVALVAVHAIRQVIGPRLDEWLLFSFAFIPARYRHAARARQRRPVPWPGGRRWIWSFVTHMLLHGDWVHLMPSTRCGCWLSAACWRAGSAACGFCS
jgi:membrane associated rhomboid family serine protease